MTSKEFDTGRINIQEKDGDPRKFPLTLSVIRSHPGTWSFWAKYDLLDRKSVNERNVRMHTATEHMIGGAMVITAVGSELSDSGLISEKDLNDAAEAYLYHDGSKAFEYLFVKDATADDVTWESAAEQIIGESGVNNPAKLVNELSKHKDVFTPNTPVGKRIHVARHVIAGRVHEQRLREHGVSERVIAMQGVTEYSGCEEIEILLGEYYGAEATRQSEIMAYVLVHFTDNSMIDSVFASARERVTTVFTKPLNVELSEAFREYTKDKESAEEIQIRVGEKVERFLSNKLGIEESKLVVTVSGEVEKLTLTHVSEQASKTN